MPETSSLPYQDARGRESDDSEARENRQRDGEGAHREADDGDDHVVAALARMWIENGGRGVPADESAGVGEVVHAGHDEPEHEQHDRVTEGLAADLTAAE